MFKTKRRKELEDKEDELYILKSQIDEIQQWCSYDSPEIGFAMLRLKGETNNISTSHFREDLRKGIFTFEEYRKQL